MEIRHHLQHYRNGSNVTKPNASNLYQGEIAVGYFADNEKLYVKNSLDKVVQFSADGVMENKLTEQGIRLSDTLGLSAKTENDTTYFEYKPTSELLKGFGTMNESVDYLAGQVKNCLELIQSVKSSVFMLSTDFTVEPNEACTEEVITYATTNNGVVTTPKSVVITKILSDTVTQTLLSVQNQSTGTVTSSISLAKEIFTIKVEPNLEGAMSNLLEVTRYLCFVGHSPKETLTMNDVESFSKCVSDGIQLKKEVITSDNEYIWICVPQELRVYYVTNDGMQVPCYAETLSVITNWGTMTCYRSNALLLANTWSLVINHQNL